MSDTRGWKDIVVILLVVVVMFGFFALAAVRTADLYYKAGWIAINFPPEGEVCTELFCLRTDTKKPEPTFLDLHFAYCPQHLPNGFQGHGGRSNGIVLYLTIFVTLLSFVTVPVFGAFFRIAASACGVKPFTGDLNSSANFERSAFAMMRTSSPRSRSGGSQMLTTFRR